MAKRYRSEALAALHETMADFHKAGAITAERMRQYDDMCLLRPIRRNPKGAAFHVFRDARGGWRWRLRAANGTAIAESGQAYETEVDCLSSIEQVRQLVAAPIAA